MSTIKDIARETVFLATISKYINGGNVRPFSRIKFLTK